MINDGAGVTMYMEENEAVENIDVVDVETGATTGKRKDAGCADWMPRPQMEVIGG
jgi:hypothetical protein